MGLESATYLSQLTATWPLAGDNKSVGDDHLRLIKSTLQATFPTGSKPFYFPTAEATATTIVLDATDQNNTVIVDTSGGNVAVTLPASLTTTDKGWRCDVIKNTNDANAAIVSPSSGSISSNVGSTATIRVGVLNEPATFFWTGAAWLCFKPGKLIGESVNYDGGSVPPGYLAYDGSVYSNTTFAELFAVLATTTLRDKRGRVEIGDGTGSGLTARVNGTTYGNETKTLAAADIPSLTSVNAAQSITVGGGTKSVAMGGLGATLTAANLPGTGGFTGIYSDTSSWSPEPNQWTRNNSISVAYTNGAQTAVGLLQPSIGVKKMVRAC